MQGTFITFEGIDGAGKSSHVAAAVAQLRAAGLEVVQTREPGGTALAEKIRALFLHDAMTPTTELLLVFAARREHLETVIWPALERGAWVVCDRFTDATVAYQAAGRGLSRHMVDALAALVHPNFAPELTLWFDVTPETAAARLAAGRADKDRFEAEQTAFFARVREGYAALAVAEPARIKRIDGEAAFDRVGREVAAHILAMLAR